MCPRASPRCPGSKATASRSCTVQAAYRKHGIVLLRRVLDNKQLTLFRRECDYLASLARPTTDASLDATTPASRAAPGGAGAASGASAGAAVAGKPRAPRGPEWVVDMLEDVPVSNDAPVCDAPVVGTYHRCSCSSMHAWLRRTHAPGAPWRWRRVFAVPASP